MATVSSPVSGFFSPATIKLLLAVMVILAPLLLPPDASSAAASHSPDSAHTKPDSKQTHAKALEAARTGDLKQAISLLSPFAAQPAKFPEIYSDYLVFLVWDKRAEDAVTLYEKLPGKFPRRPYLLRNIASAYANIGVPAAATRLYLEVLEQAPSDEEAQKGLIQSLTASGEYTLAIGHVDSFIKKFPDSTFLKQSRERLFALRDHESALKSGREGNFTQAIYLLAPYADEPLKYPEIYADYLTFLVWGGRAKEAVELYQKLPGGFPRKPYLLRNMGKAYSDIGRFAGAAQLYKDVLEQSPEDEEAQKGLVMSLIEVNDIDQAGDYLDHFLRDTASSSFFRLGKARILVLQGRYVEGFKLYRAVAAENGADREQIYRGRDDLIASFPDGKRQAMSAALEDAVQKGDTAALPDHILMLIVGRDYSGAVKAYENLGIEADEYLLSRVAWAYFKSGSREKAVSLYNKVLSARPGYSHAETGIAYCLASEGRIGEALKILDRLITSVPGNLEARFARAFVFEKGKQFWDAVHEYDYILEIARDNPTAQKLRLRALSDLGGSSLALEGAEAGFPSDNALHGDLRGDMAVHSVRWGEPKEAIKLLEPQARDKNHRRARFDLLGALARVDEMERVTTLYEEMVREGTAVPSWALSDVAGAYLYLEQPQKALDLYEEVVRSTPNSFGARMGRFYALQELREWDRAGKERDALDKETPALLGQDRNIRPNWPKMEVTLAKGWLLAYEERLREADQFFSDMHMKASYSTDTRDGLAHVWLWRGWPRKALEEFRIIETINPDHVGSRIGKADTLNSLAYKEQARKEAGDLLRAYPRNKHIQQLNRRFRVEEMREFDANASFTREEGGYEQFRADMHFFQPISLYSRLGGYVMAQKDRDKNAVRHYRRGGVGIDHVFNSSWRLRQQFSVNYDDGRDFGSFTELDFSPDDHWRFSAAYDSFLTDVPLRARVFGTDAEKYELAAVYRQSEWRDFRLGFSRLDFSDGNRRDQVALGYSQGLWVKKDWKARLMLNLYTSRNSSDDAPYFNPDKDWSVSATWLIENTRYRIYNRALVQRLYLTLGSYKQSDYSGKATGSIRYERAYDFSDTRALLLGAGVSRNAYDGELTDSFRIDLSYIWRF